MKINSARFARLKSVIGSNGFFWFVVFVLASQALWLAFSAVYPMAFDEDFHLGLIKLYAHHGSPFWQAHPAEGDAFGALTRDPSYLYHYLMSFPYRLISAITSSEFAQVMILRVINIGLFAGGMVLYRRLLLKTRASSALVNLSLLVFVLIPIVPYLAGQINYDNLIILLMPLILLLAYDLRHSMKAGAFSTRSLLILYALLLTASLVKYAFLPIALTVGLYLLVNAYKFYGSPLKLFEAIKIGTRDLSVVTIVALASLGILMTGLFIERYGINITAYHTPVPDCAQVLEFDHCKNYGPWIRDYYLEQNKPDISPDIADFSYEWVRGMWFRSFFAVSGASNDFDNKGPLTLPAVGTIVFAGSSILAFILTARRLWHRYNASVLWLFAGTIVAYTAVLWLDVFTKYLKTGIPVAINGRYLVPIFPLVILMATLSVNQLLRSNLRLKFIVAGIVLVCFVWGGGALTYVLRSKDSWYWPDSPLKAANHAIQNTAGPYTPGYRRPTQYMP